MWKLLPLLLLASCAAQEPGERAGEAPSEGSRIVRTVDLPLTPVAGAQQPGAKAFQGRDIQGEVGPSGAWSIRTAVTHTRLRCATFETGIQLGRGDAACSSVRWLSNAQFGTRQTHCNSATLIHSGGGELPVTRDVLDQSNCVRVVTRCTGPC
jgi:hypothetical protein